MADRVPIALVGTGGMARRHLNGLVELRRSSRCTVDLAAIVGRTPANAEALADLAETQLGSRPRVFADAATLARELPAVRGVSIVTDTGSHHAVALDCLQAGLHVLIEKPLALTIRGCDSLVAAAADRGLVLSVAENYRRDPMNRLARALIADGAIGEPRQMIESRIGGGNELFITPWRHQKLTGTCVFDTGVHNADILRYYLGDAATVFGEGRLYERFRFPPGAAKSGPGYASWTDFYAKGQGAGSGAVEATGEDALFAYVRFASGAIGQWTFNYAAHCVQEYRRVVYGSRGKMTCPGDRNGRPIRLEFGDGREIADAGVLDLAPSYRLAPLAAELFGDERPWTYEHPYAVTDAKLVALELHEFGDCILTGRQSEVDGLAGKRDVALINAVFESGVAGRAVSLAEVESGAVDAYQREIDLHYGLV